MQSRTFATLIFLLQLWSFHVLMSVISSPVISTATCPRALIGSSAEIMCNGTSVDLDCRHLKWEYKSEDMHTKTLLGTCDHRECIIFQGTAYNVTVKHNASNIQSTLIITKVSREDGRLYECHYCDISHRDVFQQCNLQIYSPLRLDWPGVSPTIVRSRPTANITLTVQVFGYPTPNRCILFRADSSLYPVRYTRYSCRFYSTPPQDPYVVKTSIDLKLTNIHPMEFTKIFEAHFLNAERSYASWRFKLVDDNGKDESPLEITTEKPDSSLTVHWEDNLRLLIFAAIGTVVQITAGVICARVITKEPFCIKKKQQPTKVTVPDEPRPRPVPLRETKARRSCQDVEEIDFDFDNGQNSTTLMSNYEWQDIDFFDDGLAAVGYTSAYDEQGSHSQYGYRTRIRHPAAYDGKKTDFEFDHGPTRTRHAAAYDGQETDFEFDHGRTTTEQTPCEMQNNHFEFDDFRTMYPERGNYELFQFNEGQEEIEMASLGGDILRNEYRGESQGSLRDSFNHSKLTAVQVHNLFETSSSGTPEASGGSTESVPRGACYIQDDSNQQNELIKENTLEDSELTELSSHIAIDVIKPSSTDLVGSNAIELDSIRVAQYCVDHEVQQELPLPSGDYPEAQVQEDNACKADDGSEDEGEKEMISSLIVQERNYEQRERSRTF